MKSRNVIICGGAGFIGSHMVDILLENQFTVTVIDKLTYAGNLSNIENHINDKSVKFYQIDIQNTDELNTIFRTEQPDIILNFAAETHVDNSIHTPAEFVQSNILGTFNLLEVTRHYDDEIHGQPTSRFIQISTDEVFGDLNFDDPAFTEETPYKPSSPYSATKAGADHLVRAWARTYKMKTIVTHCSNNFGQRQHAEKLIPTIVRKALSGENIPIYGSGTNIRDWLYVRDHCSGIFQAMNSEYFGHSFCFGGGCELSNLEIAGKVCAILDTLRPRKNHQSYREQISLVEDRPGHDLRYGVNFEKSQKLLGFRPTDDFDGKLKITIQSMMS